MEFMRLAIALVFIYAVGWGALSIVGASRALSRIERFALSFPVGVGLVSMEMLLTYFAGLPLGMAGLVAPWLILAVAAPAVSALRRVDTLPDPCCASSDASAASGGRIAILRNVLIGGIVFETAYAFFRALIKPIESYDAIAIYAIKSKMLYAMGAVSADFFQAMKMINPHPDYPPAIPFIETFLYMAMGSLNDQLVKIIFPLFFVSTLLLLYGAVRRFASSTYALLFVFLLATVPMFNEYATNAYHEVPLACYCFGSAALLFLYFERPGSGRGWMLPLSALLAGLAGWTKNEGLLYCVIDLAVLGIFVMRRYGSIAKIEWSAVALYPVIIMAIALPWALIKRRFGIVNSEIDLARAINPVFLAAQLHKIAPVVYEFQKQFFGPKKWLIIWPAAAAVVAINFRRAFAGVNSYIGLWLGLALAGYVFFYLISNVEVGYFASKTWGRFMLHFLPVVIYWMARTLKDEVAV